VHELAKTRPLGRDTALVMLLSAIKDDISQFILETDSAKGVEQTQSFR